MTINSSTVYVTGSVKDTAADGHCAQAQGNFDFALQPDHTDTIGRACGSGNSDGINWSHGTYGGARDFEIRICTEGVRCVIVWEGTDNDA